MLEPLSWPLVFGILAFLLCGVGLLKEKNYILAVLSFLMCIVCAGYIVMIESMFK